MEAVLGCRSAHRPPAVASRERPRFARRCDLADPGECDQCLEVAYGLHDDSPPRVFFASKVAHRPGYCSAGVAISCGLGSS